MEMRILVANADESFFRSVQRMLDAHGIWHIDSTTHVPTDSLLKYSNSISVYEENYEAALALIRALQAAPVSS